MTTQVEIAAAALVAAHRQIWPGSWPAKPEAIKLATAVLEAVAPDALPSSGWREIGSAPKDGTHILWCGDNGPFTRRRFSQAVIWWPEYKECFDTGWWQPLPTPPTAEGK